MLVGRKDHMLSRLLPMSTIQTQGPFVSINNWQKGKYLDNLNNDGSEGSLMNLEGWQTGWEKECHQERKRLDSSTKSRYLEGKRLHTEIFEIFCANMAHEKYVRKEREDWE